MTEFPFSTRDTAAIPVSDRESDDAAAEPRPAVSQALRGWEFLILAKIGNFEVLRRHLGRARADILIHDVAARVDLLLPGGRMSVLARDVVEIAFEGDVRLALDAAIATLEAAFDPPALIDGESFGIEVVLGAAAVPVTDLDDVRLVEEAERALRDAAAERNPVVRDVTRSTGSVDRIALARELPVAIAENQLFLQYQPKVHLRRQEISSVEALVRWQHPARGLILPSDFIPIAEDSRDIVGLTLWTIRQVIADQRVMADHGHDMLVFINIAGALLADARFVRHACALVEAGGTRIGFEITETSVIRDPDSAIAHLKVFADMGITVAIDDYGAGLSSLAYLKRLPARELKIDKLFVTQLTSSNRDPLIVRSTIDLAHALEMEVVAEGVETQSALALLSVMGCDMVQGFLISRPIGLDAMIAFLDNDRHLSATSDSRPAFNRPAAVFKRA